MSEKNLWIYVRKGMARHWHATRHEDAVTPGIPDVSYGCSGINGWIELKYLSNWPKKPETPVSIGLSIDQKNFLTFRGTTGGFCFLLIQIGRDYLLFNHRHITYMNYLTKNQMEKISIHWEKGINFEQFKKIIGGSNEIYFPDFPRTEGQNFQR